MSYEYVTPAQLLSDPAIPLTKGNLRQLLADRKNNGLDLCVRRVGKLIWIRKDLFIDWVEQHGEAK